MMNWGKNVTLKPMKISTPATRDQSLESLEERAEEGDRRLPIADPELEEIAHDPELARLARGGVEEGQKLPEVFFAAPVEMHVGDEPDLAAAPQSSSSIP